MNAGLWVNRIQRYCLHDGPGIRSTVFLQGCDLRCWWCHNPEMLADRSPQARCWEPRALVDELERDSRYWRASGGGVTFSGGEPLRQAAALAGALRDLGARGWHRAVETAGTADAEVVERLVAVVDLWLWDVKAVDPQRYRAGTGGEVGPSLENLRRLVGRTPAAVVARVPLIPGFSADAAEVGRIGSFLAGLPRAVPVELLPGHDLRKAPAPAGSRSARAGREEVDAAAGTLRSRGVREVRVVW